MALDLGGHTAEADRAYDWLIDQQRADGSWHQYYIAGDDGSTQVEQDKLDANVCAYVAAGVWHRWLLTDDRGFVEAMWPTVEKAIDFVLDLQQPARRDPVGPPRRRHPVELRAPRRLVVDLPQPALRHRHRQLLGHERPDWEISAARLAPSSATRPRPSPPSTAGPWTGTTPVLGGVSSARPAGPARRAARHLPEDGRGRPLRADRPWVTVAETCECVLAHLAVGERQTAEMLFGWAQQFRHDDDGRYWTGTVFPDEARFPGGERSTYTAAAVVLAADALAGPRPPAPSSSRPAGSSPRTCS